MFAWKKYPHVRSVKGEIVIEKHSFVHVGIGTLTLLPLVIISHSHNVRVCRLVQRFIYFPAKLERAPVKATVYNSDH